MALRPERVRLLPAAAGASGARTPPPARLRELAYRGEAWVALVATAGGQVLRVVLPGGGAAPPAPGGGVALAWDDDANIVLGG